MREISEHFIGGAFVESHGRSMTESINPSTGEVIGRIVLGDEEDAQRAVAAAKAAFASFSASSLEERSDYLRRLHDALNARIDDMIEAMELEFGGVHRTNCALSEYAAATFLMAERAMRQVEFTKTIGAATVSLEPLGVVGLITPWNASSTFVCRKFAFALAAGCSAVVKPSELSGIQTQVLLEAFAEADLPPGLFNLINGLGEVAGAELTRHPDVAKISFTGSAEVGKIIVRDGAETMKRMTLELGGKSPNILLDDADIDRAIPNALAIAYNNSGQACIAGSRLLVPASRLDDAKRAILAALDSTVKVGPPTMGDNTVGPMVSQVQYDRVQSYIRKGIEEGAELLAGGEGHPEGLEAGFFVKPTVFVNVTNDMTIAREEIFGPVLSVITYTDETEAVAIANDTTYGLAAYVSSADPDRARRVASELLAGQVHIGIPQSEPDAPFGGFKQSGIGRENGIYGIEAFLEAKSVIG